MMVTQLIADKGGFMSGGIPDLSMSFINTALLSEPIPFPPAPAGWEFPCYHPQCCLGYDRIRQSFMPWVLLSFLTATILMQWWGEAAQVRTAAGSTHRCCEKQGMLWVLLGVLLRTLLLCLQPCWAQKLLQDSVLRSIFAAQIHCVSSVYNRQNQCSSKCSVY